MVQSLIDIIFMSEVLKTRMKPKPVAVRKSNNWCIRIIIVFRGHPAHYCGPGYVTAPLRMKPNHISYTFRTRLYCTVTAGLEVTDSGLVWALSNQASSYQSSTLWTSSNPRVFLHFSGFRNQTFAGHPPPPTRDPPKNVTSEILLYSTSKAIELHLLVTQWKICGESKNGKMPPCEHNRVFKGQLTKPRYESRRSEVIPVSQVSM